MTLPLRQLSSEAQKFNWLLARFVNETAGVRETIAVSADGLLIAMSQSVDRADADRLAAIASALTSLADGAARMFDLGVPNKVIIDSNRGYLLVSTIGPGSVLGVIAEKDANLGNLAYDVAMFANRARTVLTPQTIDELKTTVTAI